MDLLSVAVTDEVKVGHQLLFIVNHGSNCLPQ
jgi:hypothetical protein